MKPKSTLSSLAIVSFVLGAITAHATAGDQPMPWETPDYATDIRATQAESRPGPDETGWTLWMKHHENRKRWCAEQEVDLLMIGDSIVFGWSRKGKDVWDEFYGDRKAVNIGSSGDQTYHMLWHLQNGSLDGMKAHNPKLVVMMIGTNNRGRPELHGHDTAYGILALLKEIHAKLPESDILLMPIFPRGDTPEDKGRMRNAEINRLIRTYVDGETVHWLDVGHVFLDGEGTLNRELMPDGLHPNVEGYRVWGEAMEPTIKKFLGEDQVEAYPDSGYPDIEKAQLWVVGVAEPGNVLSGKSLFTDRSGEGIGKLLEAGAHDVVPGDRQAVS